MRPVQCFSFPTPFVFHLSSLACPPSPLVLNRMQYLLTSIRIWEQRSFAERKDQLGFCTTGEQMLRLQKSSGFHLRISPQESNPVASSIRIDSERRVLLVLLNNLLQIQLFPRPEMRALFVGLGHKMLLSNPMPATQYFIAGGLSLWAFYIQLLCLQFNRKWNCCKPLSILQDSGQ